jgi:hypothetical protein
MSYKLTRVKTSHSSLPSTMPYQGKEGITVFMALQGCAMEPMFILSWAGGWKIQRFGLCSVEHPILDSLSDLSNEQIRSLRKALLRYFF